MSQATSGWGRSHYQATDWQAKLCFMVFGANPENLQLDRQKYRCSGLPEGLDIQTGDSQKVLAQLRGMHEWKQLEKKSSCHRGTT